MSPLHSKYRAAAYKQTVLAQIQRLVKERYLDGVEPAREKLICESVIFPHRFVPEDAILDVLELLQELENEQQEIMNRFEMRERDERKVGEGKAGADPQQPPAGGEGGAQPAARQGGKPRKGS